MFWMTTREHATFRAHPPGHTASAFSTADFHELSLLILGAASSAVKSADTAIPYTSTASPRPEVTNPTSGNVNNESNETLVLPLLFVEASENYMAPAAEICQPTRRPRYRPPAVPPFPLPTITACSCSLEDYLILRLRMTLELMDKALDVMSALFTFIVSRPSDVSGVDGRDDGQHSSSSQGLMTEVSQQALLAREEETAYYLVQAAPRANGFFQTPYPTRSLNSITCVTYAHLRHICPLASNFVMAFTRVKPYGMNHASNNCSKIVVGIWDAIPVSFLGGEVRNLSPEKELYVPGYSKIEIDINIFQYTKTKKLYF
ncbi:hypothetical protein B0H63DRAFT_454793 [Podospora didyma]|uniref:Uncharacterized protein n=1 Tax=Podospora didyma TaxID=330526 RepID=A0AAE0K6A1_9PEZI|nr:hypothetical protein B0H63DRAFT_454793 [Podospora didyma]